MRHSLRRDHAQWPALSHLEYLRVAAFFGKEHAGEMPAAIVSLRDMLDLLLFVAGFLTYLATAAFAASLGRVQWLGRGAARAFMIVNGVALLFLVMRGLQYPDGRATPWYTSPGFIVGIPAVPFIMPFLWGSSCSGARVKSNLKKDLTRRCSQEKKAGIRIRK